MTRAERIEAIKWNIQECESRIRDLNKQRGQFTSFNGEEFESAWEYDKYVIDTQIKDLEREISYLEGRLTTLELIESGCFYTIVNNEGVEAYV